MKTRTASSGFTLIELSIVLVIIGLIVGGVLVGQDLIRAAGVRATITQIEKYNTAVSTFRGKYGYLPGDIKDPEASTFGFAARGQYAGEGDGNDFLEGVSYDGPNHNFGSCEQTGETAMFWVDLSQANLIDGAFNTATPNTTGGTTSNISAFFPPAKIGRGNYFYVWGGLNAEHGTNYLSISAVSSLTSCILTSTPALSVLEAYSIDKKIDDGLPQTGRVLAFYLTGVTWPGWSDGNVNNDGQPYTTATPGSSSTCYDNGNSAGTAQQYSLEISGGSNIACALSFPFQ